MTSQEIEAAFDKFFEFSTSDKSYVTSVSCKLFAEYIAVQEQRRCVKICEYYGGFNKTSQAIADEIAGIN